LPQAWGNRVTNVPDVLLSGQLIVSPDLRDVKLVLQTADNRNPDWRDLFSVSFPMDRCLLADLGETFFLTKQALSTHDSDQLDEEAAKDAVRRNEGKKVPSQADAELIDARIVVGGQSFPLTPEGNRGMAKPLLLPAGAQSYHLVLKNKGRERLAVVVRVNGINTANEHETDREIRASTMWVLERDKELEIKGYTTDGRGVRPFKIAAEPTAVGGTLLQDTIELHLFREGGKEAAGNVNRLNNAQSLRQVPTKNVATLKELKASLKQGTPRSRNFTYTSNHAPTTLREVTLDHPQHAGTLVTRFAVAKKRD
jgi:hypothetical protein